MRITNKMMTNDMLRNINGNKNRLNVLEEQYSTGKKIQKPSEDPIVAVRALKLRTNLSELNQYYEKNIPDAKAWMDVTEGALKVVNDILTQMNTYCVQGSNDTLTPSDRDSISANLIELRDQIYQEGNSNYAGRYVFAGFKTDTSLVFDQITSNQRYTITEKLSIQNADVIKKSVNPISVSQYDAESPEDSDLSKKPNTQTIYRIQLAYDNLIGVHENTGDVVLNINPIKDDDGNYVLDEDGNLTYNETISDIVTVMKSDANCYTPEEGTIHFIAETGELVMAEDVYSEWKNTEEITQIHVTYEKDTFKKNELRPEHYFDCIRYDLDENKQIATETRVDFVKQDQKIEYEVNFNQKIDINTQGSDAIVHSIGRCVDEVSEAIDAVNETEKKLLDLEKLLAGVDVSEQQKKKLNEMKELLSTERTIREEVLQSTFERAVTRTQNSQNLVNVAISDLGSRYVRLELTESRLGLQQVDFTELLSQNEDADLVDTVIKFNAQETIYNASLNAASRVVQNSLLDFL